MFKYLFVYINKCLNVYLILGENKEGTEEVNAEVSMGP
jgi:hypothetical protein